jgi:hypothetical protein
VRGFAGSALLPALALTIALCGGPGAWAQTAAKPANPPASRPAPAAEPPSASPEPAPPPSAPKNLVHKGANEVEGILGKNVSGKAGDDMGLIVDMLVDQSGRPVAAVIDFGGFLGVGSRKIAIDWRWLQFRPADSKRPVVLPLDKAALQAAPEYKPDKPVAILGLPPPSTAPASPAPPADSAK